MPTDVLTKGPKNDPQHRDYNVKAHKHFWEFAVYKCSHTKRWKDGHTWIKCHNCDAQAIAEYGRLGPCGCVVTG